jgi:ATP-dependent Clp protease ATP-binding subunit ClpB
VETELSKEIIKGEVQEGDTVNIGAENGGFVFSKA